MTDQQPQTQHKLTRRQRVFIEKFLQCWNASEAARESGYKGDANAVGSRLLANDSISAEIDKRMAETQLKTNDVLSRLGQQATVNIADFIHEKKTTVYCKNGDNYQTQGMEINWEEIKRRGFLVKKIGMTRDGPMIEVHDAQAALQLIGKHLGLFDERSRVLNFDVSQLTDEQLERIANGEDPLHVITGKS